MKKYHYPAIFEVDENEMINISFPDLIGCHTFAETLEEAFENAEDVLTLFLVDLEDEKKEIPAPHSKGVEGERTVYVISADTKEYRIKHDNRAVKKTVSLPAWMFKMAEERNINCSKVLQSALKAEFNM